MNEADNAIGIYSRAYHKESMFSRLYLIKYDFLSLFLLLRLRKYSLKSI